MVIASARERNLCVCSISVDFLGECEKLVSYVSLFLAITSATESDLCVPVASVLIPGMNVRWHCPMLGRLWPLHLQGLVICVCL